MKRTIVTIAILGMLVTACSMGGIEVAGQGGYVRPYVPETVEFQVVQVAGEDGKVLCDYIPEESLLALDWVTFMGGVPFSTGEEEREGGNSPVPSLDGECLALDYIALVLDADGDGSEDVIEYDFEVEEREGGQFLVGSRSRK